MGPVQREQRQPGDDRRQREREVDDRVDDRSAPEAVADEDPGDDRPEDGVDEADADARRRVSACSAATACGSVTASQKPSAPPSPPARRALPAGAGRSGSGTPSRTRRRATAPGSGRRRGRGRLCGARAQINSRVAAGSSSRSRCAGRRTACRPSPSRRASWIENIRFGHRERVPFVALPQHRPIAVVGEDLLRRPSSAGIARTRSRSSCSSWS